MFLLILCFLLMMVSPVMADTTDYCNETINANLTVIGSTTLNGLDVTGSTTFGNTLTVDGRFYANGGISITDDISAANGNFIVDDAGDVTADGALSAAGGNFVVDASGNTNLYDNADLTVTGSTKLYGLNVHGHLDVTDSTTLQKTLTVDGRVYANDGITITDDIRAANGNFIVDLAGDVTAAGALSAAGGKFVVDGSGNTLLGAGADLDVTGKISTYGTLRVGINDLSGTRDLLADISSTTTLTLVTINLPNGKDNYTGFVDLTFIGDTSPNGTIVDDTEIFTASYLISRLDNTKTATVVRLNDGYYNQSGGMGTPAVTGSKYAKTLSFTDLYTHASAWTPNSDTVSIQFLAPTQDGRHMLNGHVIYQIRSGGFPYNLDILSVTVS